MKRAIRPQMPAVPGVGAGGAVVGRRGQNTHRPARASETGRNDIITTRVQPMPIAATGPRLLLEFSSEKLRHSNPMMTVAPDAKMAGADSFQALIMASDRCSKLCNSSR